MVVVTYADADTERPVDVLSVLEAVADPVRWNVLAHLSTTPCCVCEIQEHVSISPTLLSYHLKVLREAGLVTAARRGRWIDYALAPDAHDRLVSALPTGGGDRP